MTILERMKEIWAKEGQQPDENWEDFQARCDKEETWLFYTLPVILEVVEALERATRSLGAYLDYAPESMMEKTYAPHEAFRNAHQALDKLEAPDA